MYRYISGNIWYIIRDTMCLSPVGRTVVPHWITCSKPHIIAQSSPGLAHCPRVKLRRILPHVHSNIYIPRLQSGLQSMPPNVWDLKYYIAFNSPALSGPVNGKQSPHVSIVGILLPDRGRAGPSLSEPSDRSQWWDYGRHGDSGGGSIDIGLCHG